MDETCMTIILQYLMIWMTSLFMYLYLTICQMKFADLSKKKAQIENWGITPLVQDKQVIAIYV